MLAEVGLGDYFPFIRRYTKISEILGDRDLASLGDAYVNFTYSLALSKMAGKPIGRKMAGIVLSEALRRTGMRRMLPHRMSRHEQANAAEALLAYGWLSGSISIRETVDILAGEGELVEKVCALLRIVLERCGRLLA